MHQTPGSRVTRSKNSWLDDNGKILVPICLYNEKNLVSWFSGKLLKLLPPDVTFLRLKCTKFDFGWGSARDSNGELTWAAFCSPSPTCVQSDSATFSCILVTPYNQAPDPLAGFKGPNNRLVYKHLTLLHLSFSLFYHLLI